MKLIRRSHVPFLARWSSALAVVASVLLLCWTQGKYPSKIPAAPSGSSMTPVRKSLEVPRWTTRCVAQLHLTPLFTQIGPTPRTLANARHEVEEPRQTQPFTPTATPQPDPPTDEQALLTLPIDPSDIPITSGS